MRRDDPNDLTPWYYTAMLTGMSGDAAKDPAFAVGVLKWLMSSDLDDFSAQNIHDENARVRDWMKQRFAGVMYCFELDAIHDDLDWILSEMSTACESFPDRPDLMRNAVVYHVHNYHYRVHAYREKVAQLINALLGLGLAEKREVNAERVRDKLRCSDNSEYRAIHDLLGGLMNDPQLREVIERRTLLTHRALVEYRSGKSKWPLVTAERRAQDYLEAYGVGQEIDLWSNLKGFHQHELAETHKMVARLEEFLHDLTTSLRQLALTSAPNQQKQRYIAFWHCFVTRAWKRLSNFSVQRTPRRRR